MNNTVREALDSRSELLSLLSQPCHVEISWPTASGSYEKKRLNVSERKMLAAAIASEPGVADDIEWMRDYARDLRERDGLTRLADHFDALIARLSRQQPAAEATASTPRHAVGNAMRDEGGGTSETD